MRRMYYAIPVTVCSTAYLFFYRTIRWTRTRCSLGSTATLKRKRPSRSSLKVTSHQYTTQHRVLIYLRALSHFAMHPTHTGWSPAAADGRASVELDCTPLRFCISMYYVLGTRKNLCVDVVGPGSFLVRKSERYVSDFMLLFRFYSAVFS